MNVAKFVDHKSPGAQSRSLRLAQRVEIIHMSLEPGIRAGRDVEKLSRRSQRTHRKLVKLWVVQMWVKLWMKVHLILSQAEMAEAGEVESRKR